MKIASIKKDENSLIDEEEDSKNIMELDLYKYPDIELIKEEKKSYYNFSDWRNRKWENYFNK